MVCAATESLTWQPVPGWIRKSIQTATCIANLKATADVILMMTCRPVLSVVRIATSRARRGTSRQSSRPVALLDCGLVRHILTANGDRTVGLDAGRT